MSGKTLYVSDLDGTLLRGDETLSEFTVKTINELVGHGMCFTCATARSYVTARAVTSALRGDLPMILKNGAYIAESGTGRILLSHCFTAEESRRILDIFFANKCYPKVYTLMEGRERYSYCPARETPYMRTWREWRSSDFRDNPVSDPEALREGDIFYIAFSDTMERVAPVFEALKKDFYVLLGRELYFGYPWLEVMPRRATKAEAVLSLKAMLGCDRVVCFGDGINDMTMFDVADECYAVANAVDALKARATGVIGSNAEDGVARWLISHFA